MAIKIQPLIACVINRDLFDNIINSFGINISSKDSSLDQHKALAGISCTDLDVVVEKDD